MNLLPELFQELFLPALKLLKLSKPLELLVHQLAAKIHSPEFDISCSSGINSSLRLSDPERLLSLFGYLS